MGTYRISAGDKKIIAEDDSAYRAVKHYLKAKGVRRPFILLYTEKDKTPGWECFFKTARIFKNPAFGFIEKVKQNSITRED